MFCIFPGDKVSVQFAPYGLSNGRITFRSKLDGTVIRSQK